MTEKLQEQITFENCRIGFRNFSGAEGQYNNKGNRNFSLFIDDPKLAERMEADGWNIKYLKPRDETEEPQPYLQVTVGYKGKPPHIVMVTSRGKTPLDESTVSLLDWAEIEKVDLIIRPYNWTVRDASGVKAYVKTMFVTIHEDEIERKYSDVPDSAANTLPVQEDEAPF